MNNKAATWLFALLLGPSMLGISCGGTPPVAHAPSRLAVADMPDVDSAAVLAHITTLASDDFEGRAPGSRGEERTSEYLIKQFTQLGLKPGAADGTFIQKVPLVGITADGAPLVLKKGATELRLKWKDDVVAWTKHVADTASLKDSELVFVGYGVVAPEYNWDDYKGLDVHGKTIVMLVNDPPVPDPANALSDSDPKTDVRRQGDDLLRPLDVQVRNGRAERRRRRDHRSRDRPGRLSLRSPSEQLRLASSSMLATPDKNMGEVAIEGWVTLDSGKQLLQMAGQDFDALKKQAATREFKPVPLGIRASVTLHNTLRPIASRNVIARLDGSDPDRPQGRMSWYTAHWDHPGIGPAVQSGRSRSYNGAY